MHRRQLDDIDAGLHADHNVGGNVDHVTILPLARLPNHNYVISNTAAAAMMLPIADAILEEVFPEKEIKQMVITAPEPEQVTQLDIDDSCSSSSSINHNHNIVKTKPVQPLTPSKVIQLRKIFYLSIAYSANIGGTSTLTSNGPNLILRFVVDNYYHGNAPLDYANWFLLNAPCACVTVICIWFAFKVLYYDFLIVNQLTRSFRLCT